MTKGKYGITLWFYAALAFVLVLLDQTLLCALLLAFVAVAENNEWLTKQVIQALSLSLAANILQGVVNWVDVSLFQMLNNLPLNLSIVLNILDGFFGFVNGLISLAVLVFVVLALIKVVKEQDANLPGFSQLADKAMALSKKEEK